MTETPGKRYFHSVHFPLRGSATKSFFPMNTVQEPMAQAFPEALGTLQKTGSWQIHQLQSLNIINRVKPLVNAGQESSGAGAKSSHKDGWKNDE